MDSKFQPVVPASANIAEVTPRSIILGVILATVLASANAYLALYAGMTVGASVPAAVISMAILRGLMKTGTILENNIVQTIASTGESLAAGIVFTVPALLITGAWVSIGWTEYFITAFICLLGGLLGIVFMVPLRQSHIVESEELTFPEGVACAEVLVAGEKGGAGATYILISMVVGGLFKFFTSGISLIKASVESAFAFGRSGFYIGTDVSPALVGVGYICGFNVSTVVFLGGVVTWIVALPIYAMATGGLPAGISALDWFWETWSSEARYVGVGAMVVGGITSIFNVRDGIVRGVQQALSGYKKAGNAAVERTSESMAPGHLLTIFLIAVGGTFVLYQYILGHLIASLSATVILVVLSFFLVAVASYIVGLVGSSNSPVSGMTICAVLFTGALLLLFDLKGMEGILATLAVAGVVCCAVCSSGDISQDLKTGLIVGATPKKQQWMEVVGVVLPSFAIPMVLKVLSESYGIGTGVEGALKAPQATLFASLTQGLFLNGSIPWNLVLAGGGVGIATAFIDGFLKASRSSFRMPVMALAVGMYLPLTLTIPIFIGGIIKLSLKSRTESDTSAGTLFASGLIAGESVMGVVLGGLKYGVPTLFPMAIFGAGMGGLHTIVSLGLFAGVVIWLAQVARKA